jgi:hypothetical protein
MPVTAKLVLYKIGAEDADDKEAKQDRRDPKPNDTEPKLGICHWHVTRDCVSLRVEWNLRVCHKHAACREENTLYADFFSIEMRA